jgi:hypothetical protein
MYVYFNLLVFVLAAFCWTKSPSCNVTDFTGMPYQLKVFKYSEFISLIWKWPHYDKSQEGMPRLQEDFAKSRAQQKSDPKFIIRTA